MFNIKSSKEDSLIWHPIEFSHDYDEAKNLADQLCQYLPEELVQLVLKYRSLNCITFRFDEFFKGLSGIDNTGNIPYFELSKLLKELKKSKTVTNENLLQYFCVFDDSEDNRYGYIALKISNRERNINTEAYKKSPVIGFNKKLNNFAIFTGTGDNSRSRIIEWN